MPGLGTTTERNGTTTTTNVKWWVGLLTPQTVLYIFAGFASLVVFWNTQKNHSQHLDVIDKELPFKADDADMKSLSERVNRQYETMNKLAERINQVEKQLEYERGKHDALFDNKNEKR